MNHTFKHRSALVREAEYKHNQKQRPVCAAEITMAEQKYNERHAGHAKAFAVCLFVIVAYLIVSFVQQVMA